MVAPLYLYGLIDSAARVRNVTRCRHRDGLDGYRSPYAAISDIMSPISLQSNRIPTIALAPRAGFPPHALAGLVAAIGQELCIPADFSSCQRPHLRAEVAELITGPDDQPEHVAMHLDDPVARNLVRRDYQRGPGIPLW